MVFFFCLISCNKKKEKTQILSLSRPYSFVDTTQSNSRSQVLGVEFYIIINPPADTIQLSKQIKEFSSLTLQGIEKKYDRFQRIFYKESNNTKRTYIETDQDIIDWHGKDIIAEAHWINQGTISFLQFYKNENLLTRLKDVKLRE